MVETVTRVAARFGHRRLQREAQTLEVMIRMYCTAHHHAGELCVECAELLEMSFARLEACPYGAGKPVCSACRIHCYPEKIREKIKAVMRESGPKMIWRHPLLAIRHLWDVKKVLWLGYDVKVPERTGR